MSQQVPATPASGEEEGDRVKSGPTQLGAAAAQASREVGGFRGLQPDVPLLVQAPGPGGETHNFLPGPRLLNQAAIPCLQTGKKGSERKLP